MANQFVTFNTGLVAREFIRLLEQELVIGDWVSTDISANYQRRGDTIQARRQMQYLLQSNNLDLSAFNEDIVEGKVDVKLDQTESTKVNLSAIDGTLNFDRFSEQIMRPAARAMAEKVETALAAEYTKFYHFTGTPGTPPSTVLELAEAGAFLDDTGVPKAGRVGFHPPVSGAKISAQIASQNVAGRNRSALEMATIGMAGGFENYSTAFCPTHTVGQHGGTPQVNGASQNVTYTAAKDSWSQTLVTDGWTASVTGLLKAGDVFTIAGVYSVHPGTKASTGRLQTFTVLQDANSDAGGAATLTISPPIITSGGFQTVNAAPGDNATITVVSGTAGQSYKQSLMMAPGAMALATRPIRVEQNGARVQTIEGEKVAVTVTRWTDGNTLSDNIRFDILYKPVVLDPRLGLRLTS